MPAGLFLLLFSCLCYDQETTAIKVGTAVCRMDVQVYQQEIYTGLEARLWEYQKDPPAHESHCPAVIAARFYRCPPAGPGRDRAQPPIPEMAAALLASWQNHLPPGAGVAGLPRRRHHELPAKPRP